MKRVGSEVRNHHNTSEQLRASLPLSREADCGRLRFAFIGHAVIGTRAVQASRF